MKLRALEPMQDWQWVKSTIGCVWCEDTKGIVATRNNGQLVGAVIFDSWSPNSVQVHQGYESPLLALRSGIHVEACRYVFDTCRRGLMLGPTPANNERAIALNERFGFREVARIPDGYARGVDYVIFGMTREECPWLPREEAA